MQHGSNGNGKLTLKAARELTPPVNPVEAMRRQLALAVFGAVKEADVEAMVGKLKELALAGDHKAMKMYFELIGVMGKQAPAPPAGGGAGQVAEALRDLIDEIRISRADAPDPRKRLAAPEPDEED